MVKNRDRKTLLWFENNNDQVVHLFDNAHRKFHPKNGHFTMENTYGRVILKAGEQMPDVMFQADYTGMYTRDGTKFASFELEKIKLFNLPTEDPNVKDQLWNDNGTLKISL